MAKQANSIKAREKKVSKPRAHHTEKGLEGIDLGSPDDQTYYLYDSEMKLVATFERNTPGKSSISRVSDWLGCDEASVLTAIDRPGMTFYGKFYVKTQLINKIITDGE